MRTKYVVHVSHSFSSPLTPAYSSILVMDDYDVDMDEEEEGVFFTKKAAQSHCWEHCGENGTEQQRGEGQGGGGMVNSRSWAEELQDIFAQQAEEYFVGRRTRRSSISVSLSLSLRAARARGQLLKSVAIWESQVVSSVTLALGELRKGSNTEERKSGL